MSIALLNKQKTRLNAIRLRAHLAKASRFLGISKRDVSFVFCDDVFIRRLHAIYFNDNSATDVISFCFAEKRTDRYLGEVIVSVSCARACAHRYGMTFEQELMLYCIHGMLHLIGYDDRTRAGRVRMERMQQRILKKVLKASRSPATSKNG
ncbi:MAG: rRNA maturation RNase YbeY [Candidatus Omnitrophota bacterium]|nr:rRNA maturation RNase YbeY [Candidatus Omnitrophota bacterium]